MENNPPNTDHGEQPPDAGLARPPPWYPFSPTDRHIMTFLEMKIQNHILPMNDIVNRNVFSEDETPETLAGHYNYSEEKSPIHFFSDPKKRKANKWRAYSWSVITENTQVLGHKRKLTYSGNSQSHTNWYLDEYCTTTDIDATMLGVYKLYGIRRGKKLIQGNTTSIATSHLRPDIYGSQDAMTGTSNMLIPLQGRQVRPRIAPLAGTFGAPLSVTSSSSTTMLQFAPSQTTHHSTLPFVVPPQIFQGSNLPSFRAASFPQQSSTYLLPFAVPAQTYSPESYIHPHPSSQTNQNTLWGTQDWTSIYSPTFPANLQQYPGSSTSLPPPDAELWQQASSSANLQQFLGSNSLPPSDAELWQQASSSANLQQFLGSNSLPPSDAELWQQASSSANLQQYPGSTSLPPAAAESWEQALNNIEQETQENNPHNNQGVNPSQF